MKRIESFQEHPGFQERIYPPFFTFTSPPTPPRENTQESKCVTLSNTERRGQRECRGIFDDTEDGERLINHRSLAVRWGSGSGIDLIMLRVLPFGSICGYLLSRRDP